MRMLINQLTTQKIPPHLAEELEPLLAFQSHSTVTLENNNVDSQHQYIK